MDRELSHSQQLKNKDIEIDDLIAEAGRLTDQLQQTVTRIGETVRTHREVVEGDE
jgi:transcriptional accessory protein Tex/SPT6